MERMVQDFRECVVLPLTKSKALFMSNTATAQLILTEGLNEQQRRALVSMARQGLAYEATATDSPFRKQRAINCLEAADEVISTFG
jgi:hypothetical protein